MRGHCIKKTHFILLFAAIVCIALILCACSGNHTIVSGKLTNGKLSLSGEYESFDGDYIVTWKLPKNVRGYFEIETDTESGEISFLITDRNETEKQISDGEVYELKNAESQIKLIVRAEKHKGSFSVAFKTLDNK